MKKKKTANKILSKEKKFFRAVLGFSLAVATIFIIFAIGDPLKIPLTPCFYIGNSTPAKPCIDVVGWDTYQFLAMVFIAGLTLGYYKLLSRKLYVRTKR